jgi:hydroxymethylpyrimidine/phosphomethylpyrimidine kinase
VSAACARLRPGTPVVVDPVMVATSGDLLLARDAIDAVKSHLLPRATVMTPNLAEAAALLAAPVAATLDDMEAQARALMTFGADAVLLKGGHNTGADATADAAIDVLFDGSAMTRLSQPWVTTAHTHGTGCTLAAAIAAFLASGVKLTDAVAKAKLYVWNALIHGQKLGVGRGNGPLDHGFAARSDVEA